MTTYIKQLFLGTGISPLVSKDKGDMQNRLKCAGAQSKNVANGLAQDAVVIGGTLVGMRAAAKSKPFASFINKCTKNVVEFYKPGFDMLRKTKFGQGIANAASKFKKLPGSAKGAVAAIGLLGAAMLAHVNYNTMYKAGQIDQKYTDKADLRKHQDEVIK